MKRFFALMLAGMIGLISILFVLAVWAAYDLRLNRVTGVIAVAVGFGPAGLVLWLAEWLGWMKAREVCSDKLFQ